MRLPRAKVWRAFAEFDGMSDDECLRCLRQGIVNAPRHLALVAPLCAVAGGLAAVALNILLDAPFHLAHSLIADAPGQNALQVGVWVITIVLGGAIAGLVGRDALYYLCLRRALRRTNCRRCGQSLLGVRIIDTSLHGEPGKAKVRCPECGKLHVLLEVGLTPRDLIPLEMRTSPRDVGKHRRRIGLRP